MTRADALLLATTAFVVLVVLWFAFAGARQRSLSTSLGAKTRAAVEAHGETLARRRTVLVRVDDYGIPDASRWKREIDHFIENILLPELTNGEAGLLRARMEEVLASIDRQVTQRIDPAAAVESGWTPSAFEAHCARLLTAAGWTARTTGASGDQGADIIAEKNGMRLIVQCKLFGRPVGNAAVQEAHAARAHFGASHAAVVTNADFTRSARDLAATTGVALLHHSQLGEIERFLRKG